MADTTTTRRGFMSQRRAEDVWVSYGTYGTLSLPGQAGRKARAWLVHPDPLHLEQAVLRVATNDPKTGRAVRQDLGVVASASIRGPVLTVELQGGGSARVVKAPCVCGAGAVGMAGPVDQRHNVRQVPTRDVEWLERR